MRRLAILFALLAALHTVEQIALPASFGGWRNVCEAPRRIGRALMSLGEWRTFLIGRLRLTS
ncbi:MAG TPA: hypothetical protein VHZ74_21340 [Bryobacteraceae bacterium]|jgi:hypothetical protein|nr:hypothetical protein [Bryobacteraceae bacterium]